MNAFLIGLQFITRIPVKAELDYQKQEIATSMRYYPLIGLLLGMILVGANRLLSSYLPALVSNALLLTIWVLLSGGIHLDGLMDSCDGIFSGRDRQKTLEIMRDSRVGAFGVIAVVLLFLLKFGLLIELPTSYKAQSLILALVISRWTMVYLAYKYPYARDEGLGKAYSQYLTEQDFFLANLATAVIATLLFGLSGVIIYIAIYLITYLVAKKLLIKLGGLTGDIYGASNELAEVVSLLLIIILL